MEEREKKIMILRRIRSFLMVDKMLSRKQKKKRRRRKPPRSERRESSRLDARIPRDLKRGGPQSPRGHPVLIHSNEMLRAYSRAVMTRFHAFHAGRTRRRRGKIARRRGDRRACVRAKRAEQAQVQARANAARVRRGRAKCRA